MTSISKNVYIDKLDDIVNKYNNTYHTTIKMKPVDEKTSAYIDSSKNINDKGPKFKISEIVKILKCKNIFAKGYVPNRRSFEEVKKFLLLQKLKILCRGHLLLVILKAKKFTKSTKFTKAKNVLRKGIAKNKPKRV